MTLTVRPLLTGIRLLTPQVNIIGSGRGWNLAPSDGLSWGVNNVIFKRPVDLLFDMHDHVLMSGDRKDKCEKIAAECKRTGTTAYSVRGNPEFNYRRYPIEAICERFQTTFFTNGVCYAIAMALDMGVERIDLYGINHHVDLNIKEHIREKPGVDYWLGVATGMDVEWEVHGELSQVGRTFSGKLYGYEGMYAKEKEA